LSVGLNLWLIPIWGVIGAALAPLVANTLLNASVFVIADRLYRIPHRYDQLVLIVLAAAVTFVVASLVPSPGLVVTIGLKTGALALYPALLLALGLISLADVRRGLHWATQRIRP
jgi:O-antigen/teichoic acid export membrane protein